MNDPGFTGQLPGKITLAAATPGQQVAAAECVILHATSIADAETLLEMLGLNGTPERCPQCGDLPGAPDHERTCAPRSAGRIFALAESIRRAA